MGSTITCGKRAAAFRAADGEVVWFLFEETYESNCYPHTPHWSCGFIGDIRGAIERVFNLASDCEGGMLKARRGDITPECYIGGWMKELACPASMPNHEVSIHAGGGFYAPLNAASQVELVCEVLKKHGRTADAEALRGGGKLKYKLHEDVRLLLALKDAASISTWCIIESYMAPLNRARDESLGYHPRPLKMGGIEWPKAMKIDHNEYLLQGADGEWSASGWAYSIVGRFVSDSWKAEIEHPGCFRKRISAYREAILSAPKMPERGVRVIVDEGLLEHRWHRESAEKIKLHPSASLGDGGFEVIADQDVLYELCHLPRSAVKWMVPPTA